MQALVTGGTGFIGSYLVAALAARGDRVRCLLRPTSDRKWLQGLDYKVVTGGLEDGDALAQAAEGVDVVYHLAGVVKARDEKTYFRVNADGTARLAAACAAQKKPPVFILCSSQAAAGPCRREEAVREEHACVPITPYGRSKLAAEQALGAYTGRLPWVTIRPTAIYGPRDAELLLLFKFVAHGIEPAIGWDDRFVSLCYVDDLVAALVAAGAGGTRFAGETFFVAHPEVLTWRVVCRQIARALGMRTRRVAVPKAVLFGAATVAELASTLGGGIATLNRHKARELAQARWVVDVSKARASLGFEAKSDFETGCQITAAWYREQGWL